VSVARHPLKNYSELGRLYREAEELLQAVICDHFGLARKPPAALKEADRAMLAVEHRTLMVNSWAWPELAGVEPADVAIEPWDPPRAAEEFLRRYRELRSE
jgi:hypothetical protein